MTENYKTIAEFDKQAKKLTAAVADRDNYKGQLDAANETLEKFKDIDPEKQAEEIQKYKQAAKEAQEAADKRILQRDQRDWVNKQFDEIGVTATHTREYYAGKVMDKKTVLSGKMASLSDLKIIFPKKTRETTSIRPKPKKQKPKQKRKPPAVHRSLRTSPSRSRPRQKIPVRLL